MKKTKVILAVIMMSLCLAAYGSQKAEGDDVAAAGKRQFKLHYVINKAELDSTFVDNARRMFDVKDFLSRTAKDPFIKITGIDFIGTASPDGSYEFNVWLSKKRLGTFKKFVRDYVDISDSLIGLQNSDIPWKEFRAAVAADPDVPMKEAVLEIIDEDPKLVDFWGNRHIDHRLLKLKRLSGGKVWDYLKYPILFNLRYGEVTFYYIRSCDLIAPDLSSLTSVEMKMPDIIPLKPSATVPLYKWTPQIYLKTNLLGLALANANIAFEADLAPHWSLSVPIYYCAWDYFKSTIKFRNFTVQPEVRYWFNANEYNHGFFMNAHVGMMYYNFAVDGSTRFQDYRGRTPALGGGLGIGFRKAVSKNGLWHIECALGAGVYRLDYSKFYNTPNVDDGLWFARRKKTFIGFDQAAVSLSYSIPLSKYERMYRKGGGR